MKFNIKKQVVCACYSSVCAAVSPRWLLNLKVLHYRYRTAAFVLFGLDACTV